MVKRFFLFGLLVVVIFYSQAQVKAKAISYNLEVDLHAFAPSYAEETETEDITCTFEVDAYFTADKLRTIVRSVKKPADYDLSIRQRLYDIHSKDEYNIDHNGKIVMLRKNQIVKPKATGKEKILLGYLCKEYTFTDFRNVALTAWVTDKLPRNICPAGNFSLKGTALEVITSNGLHYVATDFAEGELATGFYDIPADYTLEVTQLGPADKKSK